MSGTPKPPKPTQLYHDAVWEAGQDALTTTELVMALCYANHAHKPLYDRAWVVDTRLMDHCKIRSTSSVARIRDALVSKGWLTPLHPDTGEVITAAEAKGWQRRRKSIVYLLTIPATSTVEVAAATSVSEVATSTVDGTTSMSGAGYFDHRGLPSQDPLEGPSLSSAGPAAPVPAAPANGHGERELLKKIGKRRDGGPPSTRDGQPSALPATTPLDLVRAAAVVPPGDERELIQWIENNNKIQGLGWWITVCGNGTIRQHAAKWQAQRAASPKRRPRPDWCGTCHEHTRMVETDDGRPAHCTCHPNHPARRPDPD